MAPAPWTYPSHSCFFTGQWPFQLNSQWRFGLDIAGPTLAEYLTSRGYQTAGFSANTKCCNYETGLASWHAPISRITRSIPRALLGRTVPGNWLLSNILYRRQYHDMKWIGLQSRGARGTNEAFLSWLRRRRPDRPFFAFLNYFDAHDAYMPPPGFEGRFGIRPTTSARLRLPAVDMSLENGPTRSGISRWPAIATTTASPSSTNSSDGCSTELRVQGLLDNTVVIITSDHGEAFGDHGRFGHGSSLFLDEIGVPLVILCPGAPAGRVVESPVSLRDLPATVVDLLGFRADSPFPGRPLAAYWRSAPGQQSPGVTTPALSEQADTIALEPQFQSGPGQGGFQFSLTALGHHYIRDGSGNEVLYDLRSDRFERHNLMGSSQDVQTVGVIRNMLLDVLTHNPGSIEAEAAYMRAFRQGLKAAIREMPAGPVAAGP